MNGIGPDTRIKVKQLPLLTTLIVLTVVFWAAFILLVFLWVKGKKAWKKTKEYQDYQTLRKTIKEEKKQK